MHWLLLVTVLLGPARGQDPDVFEVEPFELTDAEADMCEPTGYYADPNDCCFYVQCSADRWEAWKIPCMGGTVWSSRMCACVHPEDNTACDPTTCNVAGIEYPECPETLEEGQCCLPVYGKLFTSVSTNSYKVQNDTETSTCPDGQEFNMDACYCEGEWRPAPCPCLRFTFTEWVNRDVQGIVATVDDVFMTPFGSIASPEISAMFGAPAATFSIPTYSNIYWGDAVTISFNLQVPRGGTLARQSVLVHNGKPGGDGASLRVELLTTADGTKLVAGVDVCDGPDDIVEDVEFITERYVFFAVVYNKGELTVYIGEDDTGVSVMEQDEIRDTTARDLAAAANAEAADAANSVEAQEGLVQEVTQCVTQIKATLDSNKDFINNLFITYKDARKEYTSVLSEYKKKKNRRTELFGDLQSSLTAVDSALTTLEEQVDAIADAQTKLCDLELGDIFETLEGDLRNSLKKLKRRIGTLKGKIEDGRGIAKMRSKIEQGNEFVRNAGRRRRDADSPDSSTIRSTKYPLTLGEDWIGLIDDVIVCSFAATPEQVASFREGESLPDFIPEDPFRENK